MSSFCPLLLLHNFFPIWPMQNSKKWTHCWKMMIIYSIRCGKVKVSIVLCLLAKPCDLVVDVDMGSKETFFLFFRL